MKRKERPGKRKDTMAAIKVTQSLDARSLKTYRTTAARLGLPVSALLRLLATKIESGEAGPAS